MIRKIEGEKAWVLYKKDIDLLFKIANISAYYVLSYRLPLLETNPLPLAYKDIKEDDLIIVCTCDTYFGYSGDTLSIDFIEKVNKRWSEFYD